MKRTTGLLFVFRFFGRASNCFHWEVRVEVMTVAGMQDKVALISGGARGMGAAHARQLLQDGATGVLLGDVLVSEGQALAAELGERCRFIKLDVTSREDWEAAVAVAERTFGALNVLVNNAGIADWKPLEDYPVEDWARIMDINLTGTFLGIKAVIPAMRRFGSGSIINVSSVAGMRGSHYRAGYTASKFAVRGLTKAAALELGRYNIRVNSIHPGAVNTPFIQQVEASLPAAGQGVALGRRAEPEELAKMVAFLASDHASFSTGAEFIADGGVLAGVAPGFDE